MSDFRISVLSHCKISEVMVRVLILREFGAAAGWHWSACPSLLTVEIQMFYEHPSKYERPNAASDKGGLSECV